MRMLSPLTTSWSRRPVSAGLVGDVFEDFDHIVDSFLRPTYISTTNFQTACDVSETKDHFLVSFDMPGVKAEDIKIEVKGNQLMISGERRRHEKENVSGAQTLYGKYERTFELPTTVNTEKIEAHHENGVLNLVLPKAEAAKPKTIQIQTGESGFFSKLLGSKKEAVKDVRSEDAS